MITLVYTRYGSAIGDSQVESVADMIVEDVKWGRTDTYNFSTFTVIECVGALVAEGKLPADSVQIQWGGETYSMDKYGQLPEYPIEVSRFHERILKAMLGLTNSKE